MQRMLLGLVVFVCGAVNLMPANAADYSAMPRHERQATRVFQIDRGPNPYCGPRCGCPIAVKVRHRSLVQYYPSNFDPRTRDEPRYAYGPNQTYVRFANPACPERVLEY